MQFIEFKLNGLYWCLWLFSVIGISSRYYIRLYLFILNYKEYVLVVIAVLVINSISYKIHLFNLCTINFL